MPILIVQKNLDLLSIRSRVNLVYMQISKLTLVLLVSATLLSACGAPRQKFSNDVSTASSEKDGKGLVAHVDWVKKKTKWIDMQLTLTNKYNDDVRLSDQGFKLTFNGKEGKLHKHEGASILPPNAGTRHLVIFGFPKNKEEGTAVLTIDKIDLVPEKGQVRRVSPMKIELPLKSPI